MFDKICIRHQKKTDAETAIDLGFLAEAMIFYQQVHVIADMSMLKELISSCGPELLLELLEHNYLSLTYLTNDVAIQTTNTNTPHERHEPVIFSMPSHELQEVAPKLFREATGRSGRGRRLAQRFSSLVSRTTYQSSINDKALEDFTDSNYMRNSVIQMFKLLAHEYKGIDDIVFAVFHDQTNLIVETNIDFIKANESYHKRISPRHSSLSVAYLLSYLMSVRGDLYFASLFGSEIATDFVTSTIIKIKFNDLLSSRFLNESKIQTFQDFVFEDAKAIREVINSGERSFTDLLKLLSKANKFHHWLKDKTPDTDLLKAYYHEVTGSTWVEKLPGKTTRWSLFTIAGMLIDALGAGGIGTAIGLTLSIANSFFLERLIKGWKPNQFVEGSLKKFVKREETVDDKMQPSSKDAT